MEPMGQGILELVREKSGNSQGISLGPIAGNPVKYNSNGSRKCNCHLFKAGFPAVGPDEIP